jgi:hypothetical protein
MRYLRPVVLALTALSLTACVPAKQMYRWGSYDTALYKHYKSPQDREGFVANLKEVIAKAEQGGGKVPPGCYAEYGYALLEEGQRDAAVEYFTKERDLWPESRAFMDKMIQNTQRQGVPQAPAAKAAPRAVEEAS